MDFETISTKKLIKIKDKPILSARDSMAI